MSYIKEIGFRESFNRKYVLQVLVQTMDKDFDKTRKWKDANLHDLLEACYRGFIKGKSVYSDKEKKPDKTIKPPKFDIVSEGGSRKP